MCRFYLPLLWACIIENFLFCICLGTPNSRPTPVVICYRFINISHWKPRRKWKRHEDSGAQTKAHIHTTVCICTPSKMEYDVLICQAVIASLDNLSSSSHICQFTCSHTRTDTQTEHITHTGALFLCRSPLLWLPDSVSVLWSCEIALDWAWW